MNIYDGCVDCSETFYRDYSMTWDEQLNAKEKHYRDKGYKVVFVFLANSFQDAARVVLYNKDDKIPEYMREYRNKYVRMNGHWVLESSLGICDQCGEYAPIVLICRKGQLCDNCDN